MAALTLCAAIAVGAAWLWTRGDSSPSESIGPQTAPRPAEIAHETGAADESARTNVTESAPHPPVADPLRFRGRGRIRGELRGQGFDVPERWTLILEPHPTLIGSEYAEVRRIEFLKGETRFDVQDLPLGGYRVRAEALGLNSSRASAPLARGASDAQVTLYLSRAGIVDGFVFDHEGRAAEGLAVRIENTRTHDVDQVDVDATGMFLARDIVDGEYTIAFGSREAPLVAPQGFTFRAPSMRWPETRLPPSGSARIRVVDTNGVPMLDAEVLGSASPVGVVRGRTGGDGAVIARYLHLGRYEITATAPDGRTGRANFEVGVEARADVQVHVD